MCTCTIKFEFDCKSNLGDKCNRKGGTKIPKLKRKITEPIFIDGFRLDPYGLEPWKEEKRPNAHFAI